MTPHQFIAKWKQVTLKEVSAYIDHFNDLCELLGEKKPTDVDPSGAWFTFQKGVTTTENRQGYADVWRRGFFGWEYKGKHKDLKAAYQQLLKYREALLNPPLLIVCDLDRFEVHTNFPNTVKKVYAFDLDGLADPANLHVLKAAFTRPEDLRPGQTQEQVTREIADRFCKLADGMRDRGEPADRAGHFLMKLMFCMFAEDIDLLPRGLFAETVKAARGDSVRLSKLLAGLFAAMAEGGNFGTAEIAHINGGLFGPDADVVSLDRREIAVLLECAGCDWSQVEPSIFGTLFERILDPDKRGQLGAHYTGTKDIETLLRPVFLDPLRREWDAVRERADALYAELQEVVRRIGTRKDRRPAERAREAFDKCVNDFFDRLAHVTVLDPACGSGNFLYVALRMLLDLEKEVWVYATARGLAHIPQVGPQQLRGLELNTYAQQLASVVIWIGYLQWMHDSGIRGPGEPVLDRMENIRQTDAILDVADPDHPHEPTWPDAEFIVGNPPFLGNKLFRAKLGDDYAETLWRLYADRLPAMSDLCCYWFEKARAMIEADRTKRAGLLATTGIKQVGGRRALERICETGRIFFAESDRPWLLEGAAVRIVMVGFGPKDNADPTVLDGKAVAQINADLTGGVATVTARRLAANTGRCFMGTTKVGDFDIPFETAKEMLGDPNPHGKPNSDVLRPWVNGSDLVRNPSHRWIIDFGTEMPEDKAALYAKPFAYLGLHVKPARQGSGQADNRLYWWIHARPRPALREALAGMHRYIGTARVAKHRIFVWLDTVVLPDSKVIAVAFDDDFRFGVLHSRVHQVWTLAQCGWHGKGNDATYNPNTCFLTFPFPEPTGAQREAVAAAAKELDALRSNWLNPPEWTRTEVLEFPGSADGPWKRYVDPATITPTLPSPIKGEGKNGGASPSVGEGNKGGVGTVRYPRTVAKDAAAAAKLKARTLTNLYNEQPAWLTAAHRKLDEAVFAAYGWPPDLGDDDLLARLLALNLSRAGTAAVAPPDAAEDDE